MGDGFSDSDEHFKKEKTKMEQPSAIELRQTVAMEKTANALAGILDCLMHIVDGNDSSLRMKDIERSK